MNLKQYITLMIISSCLAWFTWGFIVWNISPEEAGLGVFFLFYVGLLMAMSCTFSILGLLIRSLVLKQDEIAPRLAAKSFRQAILLSILFTGILYFQSKHILNWWIIILFIAILTALEFFLISYRSRQRILI